MSGDQTDRRQSHGPSDFDRTHRVVLSAVYQTPNLRSGPAIAKTLLVALAGFRRVGVAVGLADHSNR